MVQELQAGQVRGVLVLDGKKFNVALENAGKKTKQFEKNQIKQSSAIKTAWKSALLPLVTFAAAGFIFKKGVDSAIAFEAELANISTLGDFATDTMAEMKQEVKDLSRELNVSNVEAAKGLYQAISSGANAGTESIDILTESIKLSKAGIASIEASVNAATNVINVFGIENLDAARTANVMFKVVQKGKTTMAEFGPQVGKVSGFAKDLGLSFEQVAAASALLTRTMPTPQAMTALEATMRALTNQSAKFAKAGVDIFEVLREDGLGGALKELQRLTGGNIEEIKKFIPETEALKGVLGLLKNEVGDYNNLLKVMEDKTNVVNEAVAKQMDTTKDKTAGLGAAFGNLSDTIFEKINPAYDGFLVIATSVLEVSEKLIKVADDYNEETGSTVKLTKEQFALYQAGIVTTQKLTKEQFALVQAKQVENKILDKNLKKQKEIDQAVVDSAKEDKNAAQRKAEAIEDATNSQLNAFEIVDRQNEASKNFWKQIEDAKQEKIKETQKTSRDAFWSSFEEFKAAEEAKLETSKDVFWGSVAALQEAKDAENLIIQQSQETARDAFWSSVRDAENAAQESQDQMKAWLGSWETAMKGAKNVASGTFQGIKNDFASAVADISVDLKFQADTMDGVWKSLQKNIISGLIKIGIQQVAQFALTKFLSAGRIAFSSAEAAATSAAWATPAALTSLATLGANAIPASAGIASTVALAQTLAIPKFQDGGPTDGGLALLHPREFVLSETQTEGVSEMINSMNQRLDAFENSGIEVMFTAKDSAGAAILDMVNYEVRVNKRRIESNQ